ncbi:MULTISPECIES: succinyldiaminopimelate transaminase [Bifidobacterium]|uniref:Succinyldiaminopimelate transaminase n=1 Tax=Bifidobacterium reuteri DSM 23975 TaxID=1437610 RepID=A0A087CYW9_9BIFI|nr:MULTISPECIES: succinyldiaminopimelate transaminase [Bifidobacterium]KFI88469.1 Succinyldiaminopimelate transaminase [Bifidobacterium reuteri DSM 23975]TPF78951.1 N-succinyldiaminopimelate aminotransferase [Bifidobacterium sp. UTCIF-1]TPF80413.1 N-succinyldiaminopimelate aminotransferase [Bifidobacterium sp. UTCIF-24]TPF82852.1 N-succinyldiaminopimelate aminotransferase [Bifidobacterium sp. UTCIF-3]TPF89984.1 N-succinyldiaminopimelate aminotransferase [Bifidobacterium sp. UTBIF-56]
MGFHAYSSPYDWSRIAGYKATAKAAPGGMVDLSVGSPVDPVPASVQQALVASADAANAHGYPVTAGSTDLKEAMDAWFRRIRGVDLKSINAAVVPTVGSKEAVALMASLLHLGPGDVVVQPKVSYPTYEIGTQLAGATVLKVDDVADVESWVDEPNIKAIWVNSPCNPTGEVIGADWLAEIVAAARRIGAVVLSDECYALMDWRSGRAKMPGAGAQSDDGGSNEPAAAESFSLSATPCALNPQVCEGSADGILVLYSLSKQSNMAGYRTALIAGDYRLVREMSEYRKQIGEIIPGPVQAAMAAGLRDTAAVHEQWGRYHRRLTWLVDALGAYGYQVRMPAGALYVWVKAKSGDCWTDMAELAKIGIIPSPGEFYGAPAYLRFSATATDEAIQSACRRLVA